MTAPNQYLPPAVSVRATFAATDGSMPEEITIEWGYAPRPDDVRTIVRTLAELPRNTGYNVTEETTVTATGEPVRALRSVPDGEAETEQLPRPICNASLPEFRGEGGYHRHRCGGWAGHTPITPSFPHSCAECGELFDPAETVRPANPADAETAIIEKVRS